MGFCACGNGSATEPRPVQMLFRCTTLCLFSSCIVVAIAHKSHTYGYYCC
jgi:hypothetical protein